MSIFFVGMPGLEPGTFVLSGQRSSQLSYMPKTKKRSRTVTSFNPLNGRGKVKNLFPKKLGSPFAEGEWGLSLLERR